MIITINDLIAIHTKCYDISNNIMEFLIEVDTDKMIGVQVEYDKDFNIRSYKNVRVYKIEGPDFKFSKKKKVGIFNI